MIECRELRLVEHEANLEVSGVESLLRAESELCLQLFSLLHHGCDGSCICLAHTATTAAAAAGIALGLEVLKVSSANAAPLYDCLPELRAVRSAPRTPNDRGTLSHRAFVSLRLRTIRILIAVESSTRVELS